MKSTLTSRHALCTVSKLLSHSSSVLNHHNAALSMTIGSGTMMMKNNSSGLNYSSSRLINSKPIFSSIPNSHNGSSLLNNNNLWSNKIASYHTSINNLNVPPTPSSDNNDNQNQRILEAKKKIEERMKNSSTAKSLLTPMNADSVVQIAKDKTLSIVKAIPSVSWKVTVFLFDALKSVIMRPTIVKDWYAKARDVTVHEIKHYVAGSKLLASDVRYAFALTTKVLRGNALSRRERNQLLRTVSDIFRLVPFAIIVVVPFLEFALPVLLKLFPNMLPSQFEDGLKKKENY